MFTLYSILFYTLFFHRSVVIPLTFVCSVHPERERQLMSYNVRQGNVFALLRKGMNIHWQCMAMDYDVVAINVFFPENGTIF